MPGPKDTDDLIFSSYTPSSFSVLKVDCNEIRGGWGGGGIGKIGYVGYWSRTVAINVLLSVNFDYVFYSKYFRFHQVNKGNESFAALSLLSYFRLLR